VAATWQKCERSAGIAERKVLTGPVSIECLDYRIS